ncbi:MAG TPA: hypothetical protein VNX27_10480 [Chthoniobacterales bacterium]|nr:hypothetical protein [Chthoniobacterales bacterium]
MTKQARMTEDRKFKTTYAYFEYSNFGNCIGFCANASPFMSGSGGSPNRHGD